MLNLLGLIELGNLAIMMKQKQELGIDEAISHSNKVLESIRDVALKKKVHLAQISTC